MGKNENKDTEKYQILFESDQFDIVEENDIMDELDDEIHYQKLIETAEILRKRLIEFSDENALPLCEYLDMENTYNFVEWVVTKRH